MSNPLIEIESLYSRGAGAWTPDPEYVKSLDFPVISLAAPSAMELPDRDTFLTYSLDTVKRMTDPDWKYEPQFQKSGTCGGQAGKNAYDIALAHTCLIEDTVFPGRSSVAGFYAGSRVEIARQPGRGLGTNGVWVAEFAARYGAVLLKDMNLPEDYYYPDSMDPDEKFSLEWCRSREGVPAQYEKLAKSFPLGSMAQVRNARECGKLIQLGCPAIVGCDLIPTGRRDRFGFSQLLQQSGHLTCFVGVRYNPFGLLYLNSWGKFWAQGPVYYPGQWDSTVWLDEDSCNAMIRQGDTFAFTGVKNLHSRYKPAFKTAA